MNDVSIDKKPNPYRRLSEAARKRNIEYSNMYNREKATRITIKVKNENFADIEKYMNRVIADGKAKSKNNFIVSAMRYAMDNDIFKIGAEKGIDEKSE